jgi:hypothetical protein
MTEFQIAIVIFIATGLLGFLAKVVYDKMSTTIKKHSTEHVFVRECMETQKQRDLEHLQIMESISLLIESNISQIASSLLRQHKEYMQRGNVTTNEYETFERLYKSYTSMGGNGTIKKLFEDVEQLPIGFD